MAVRQEARKELTRALQDRYRKADRKGKGTILDTFCAATGYNRKYAIELLKHGAVGGRPRVHRRRGRPVTYDARVIGALRAVAEAADWICGKRLAPALPDLIPAMEREGALSVDDEVRTKLLDLSAATIDRRLSPERRRLKKGLSTTKPGTLLKSQIPIQTYLPWDDLVPGFVEIDLVAHCGTSMAGEFAYTLNATDIATGWTDCTAIPNRGQFATVEAITRLRERFPFSWKGIDSDNGSEFINHHLLDYCQQSGLTFTRCRAYHKDDQAYIEQKNWDVVRKTVGYDRFRGQPACDQLERIYDLLRLYRNCFLPVMKCVEKQRRGSQVRKRYDRAATPMARAIAAGAISDVVQTQLKDLLDSTGPMTLRRHLDRELSLLWEHHAVSYAATTPATA